ncbi:hypothetical protein B0J14DRAFT_597721 [Halenospora varia]|nr:hypothetical protein B0J14DRAFT_597721 [Halenospora varia]
MNVFSVLLLSLFAFAAAADLIALTGFTEGHAYIPRRLDARELIPLKGCMGVDNYEPCTPLPISSWGSCTDLNSTWDKSLSSVMVEDVPGIFCQLFDTQHCDTWVNQTSSYNCFVF